MLFDNSRLFTDAYDYNSLFTKMSSDDLAGSMGCIARLRLDSVFFQQIVLTDAQLFHSLFFSEATSISTRDEDSVSNYIPYGRLEIRSRMDTLEDSLLSLIYDPSEHYLKPHLFTYIDKDKVLADRLSTVPAKELSGRFKKIPKVLISIGADEIRVSKAFDAWNRWIEMSKAGRLSVKKWEEYNYNSELSNIMTAEESAIRSIIATRVG